jgi:hypothetical protein
MRLPRRHYFLDAAASITLSLGQPAYQRLSLAGAVQLTGKYIRRFQRMQPFRDLEVEQKWL